MVIHAEPGDQSYPANHGPMNQERWGYDMLGDRDVHPKMGVELWDANHRHVECMIFNQTRMGDRKPTRMRTNMRISSGICIYIYSMYINNTIRLIYLKMD